ncbi:unnamed protein product [Kuraishia capsulata CBS 1993]|uniref:Uncharacterized protein n=1 Tax=Kuraishia capsulata CBS 1993 TaxID=1382522 RepID=W6MKV3_9ASCO|nr:uncharacterized protein KUCA_T00002998001 [Kuraishia capsulata CBS 1993]CDK27021.1 unnamed protein product [Kuraishia capsulata CBS 1993]
MSAMSYQNAGSMPGWNDCPVIPSAGAKKKRSVSQLSSASNSRTSLYSTPPTPGSAYGSQTRLTDLTPPPVMASRVSSRQSSVSNDCDSESPYTATVDELLKMWDYVTVKENALPEKELKYHLEKVKTTIVRLGDASQRQFLFSILRRSLDGEVTSESMKEEVLSFMMSNGGVSWCVSLRKVLENVVDS